MAKTQICNGSKKREQTAQKIIQALHASNGLVTLAAKKAGLNYRTVCKYVEEFPSVSQAVIDAKDHMLDFAESKLYQKIREGDNTAIIFYLKTQGKGRGYIERQEFTGRDGQPIRTENKTEVLVIGSDIMRDALSNLLACGAVKVSTN